MDHNFDLVKTSEHSKTRSFLDEILGNGLIPTITRPTRITRGSTTLINNIFISGILQKSYDSLILLEEISYHMPTLTMMRQTKLRDKTPL